MSISEGRAAAQPDGDWHVGRIPRGIDGLPKALGEFGGAAKGFPLLKYRAVSSENASFGQMRAATE